MSIKIAINGFGRIGRLAFRRAVEVGGFEIVALNDLSSAANLAYLLKYDTAQGVFHGHTIECDEGAIIFDGKRIPVIGQKDPALLNWSDYGVDIVLECTGRFKGSADARVHIEKGGAKGVIISAPADKDTPTFVYGVNSEKLTGQMDVISGASCTTNCLAPVMKVLEDNYGVEGGFMTTVHAYTNDQSSLDLVKEKDFRRGRACAANLVPSSTGAAKAIDLVIPSLKGRMQGGAIRVPVICGSLVDLTLTLKKEVKKDEINALMKAAATNHLKGILDYTEEPIVSSDILGNPAGSIFDATQTAVFNNPEGKQYVKVVAWGKIKMAKTIEQVAVKGKVVFVRVDFNVPLKDSVIRDDNRIVQALPTIQYLIKHEAKVVLLSHLGKVDHKDPAVTESDKKKNNLMPISIRLAELLGQPVKFVNACVGASVVDAVNKMKNGEVVLLQNTRYEKGESKNDIELAASWADLADVFVMDAFGSAHRAHSSTYALPEILNKTNRETAVGFLVQKEVVSLDKVVHNIVHPYVAILGGAKVSDKIKVIEKLLEKADTILVGGAMAYTFLKAIGTDVAASRVEEDFLEFARNCYASKKIILPVDHVATNDFNEPTDVIVCDAGKIKANYMGLDIGPKTIANFEKVIAGAKTIFWNGPLGVFENEKFAKGTSAILAAVKNNKKAFTVIGGGDTAAAAVALGFDVADFSHVSTGGGASLEMIENNGVLPGIEIIAK
ncbi:phosphoglycerate kinase [Holotrichia oblita]|nr:phosphoglycerate kinase [Holotrichia oblita]